MANIVKIKRRASGGSTGAPSALKSGELAVNEGDTPSLIVYYGAGDDGSGNATSIVAIGGAGAAMILTLAQTISGNKTFTGAVDMTGGTPTVPTATLTDSTTKAASTAFVAGQFSGITGATKAKVTYNAKGLVTAGDDLIPSDIPTLTAAKISDFDTQVRTNRLDQMAAPTSNVSLGSNRITNLSDPSSAQDAATQAWVQAQLAAALNGQDWKASVRVATTANVSLSGGGIANGVSIDGVTLATGDRVLVKSQTTGSENGVYLVPATGAASRTTDMDTSAEASPGTTIIVEEGTANGDTIWILTTNAPITLGTTSLTFTQLPGGTSYTGTSNRITVSGNTIDIASNYVGQTSITTLGTVTTGALGTGFTVVGVAQGGSGAATLTGILKGNGTSAFTAATAGTDYLSPSSTIDGGTF